MDTQISLRMGIRQFLLVFKLIHGDVSSVDSNVIETWYGSQLKDHIHLVDPDNIYNSDELGLFWHMQARASYAIKDKICKFGKHSKERMTIYSRANMTGSHKLPITIIGKSEKPRQMYIVKNLDFNYYFNQSAWMTIWELIFINNNFFKIHFIRVIVNIIFKIFLFITFI